MSQYRNELQHTEERCLSRRHRVVSIKALCSALVVLAHTLLGKDPESAGVAIEMQLDAMGWLACGLADAVEKLEQLVATPGPQQLERSA